MFVHSVLGLVGLSSCVAGVETRAFSVQVWPPSSLRMIPIVVVLRELSFCEPTRAYTRAVVGTVAGATARSMRPIPDVPAAEMSVPSCPESRTDVQRTPLSADHQMSPRFPGTVAFGAGQEVAPTICRAVLGPLKPGQA